MTIEPMQFTIKDGRTATIRSPKMEDAEPMLSYLYRITGQTPYLMNYPEETSKYTLEGEIALFEGMNKAPNQAMILCEVDGQLAANCMIRWGSHIKTRHRASLAISVLKEYWNLGIGTRLMEELLRIAKNQPQLMQVELEFIEGNTRARALYEKMGFRITGVKPNAICLKDGTLLDEYMMMYEIKR